MSPLLSRAQRCTPVLFGITRGGNFFQCLQDLFSVCGVAYYWENCLKWAIFQFCKTFQWEIVHKSWCCVSGWQFKWQWVFLFTSVILNTKQPGQEPLVLWHRSLTLRHGRRSYTISNDSIDLINFWALLILLRGKSYFLLILNPCYLWCNGKVKWF